MPRVKRGTTKNKRRHNILKETKGYIFGRNSKKREARQGIFNAGIHAFNHRRDKKNDFRRNWQVKIAARLATVGGPSYSKFIPLLKKHDIRLDRKMLAELAENEPEVFDTVTQKVTEKKSGGTS